MFLANEQSFSVCLSYDSLMNGSYSWRYQYLEAISMKTKGNRQIYQIVSMYLIILTSYFKKKRLQSLSCKQYWELVGSSSRLSVKDRQIKHFFSS